MPPIAVLIEYRVRPGCGTEFEARLRADCARTLADDGCLRMEVLRPRGASDVLWLSELWRDEAAIEAHRNAPGHSHAWQTPLIVSKRVTVCDAL